MLSIFIQERELTDFRIARELTHFIILSVHLETINLALIGEPEKPQRMCIMSCQKARWGALAKWEDFSSTDYVKVQFAYNIVPNWCGTVKPLKYVQVSVHCWCCIIHIRHLPIFLKVTSLAYEEADLGVSVESRNLD